MLESELFAFLEGTTDAAFTVSEQGEILSWNRAAGRLFGYSSSEVLGKSCFQVLQGRGVLGTQVCHEGCSVLECTAGQTEIPNFDLRSACVPGSDYGSTCPQWYGKTRGTNADWSFILHMTSVGKRQRNEPQRRCCRCPVNSTKLQKNVRQRYPLWRRFPNKSCRF